MSRKFGVLAVAALGLSLVTVVPAAAQEQYHVCAFPTEFALPDGFQPEGIAIGLAPTAYFGSLRDGSLYRADLRTGRGEVFSKGTGTPSVGLAIDRSDRIFVAGGPAGDARVVDARGGTVLKTYRFAETETFVNDVVVTDEAAWYTDSFKAVLYKVPFVRDGALPPQHTTVPLTGDFALTPGAFNANGITTTPDGTALLVVQSNTGKLFRVDPDTGTTKEVDLGGQSLTSGDGLLREGRTLYVVQNRLNTVAEYRLDQAGTSGELVVKVTDPRFDVPTTVASFGNRLYLPNARFGTPPTPETGYDAVAVDKP